MLKSNLPTELSDKMLRHFSGFGLSPNVWTLLSILPAFGGFFSLYCHNMAIGLLLFAISGFIDMVDGAVARATNSSTVFGAFIDGVLDRYVELLLFLGLSFYIGSDAKLIFSIQVWMVLLVFGSVMTSFVRAYADHRGLINDHNLQKKMGGLLERAERLLLLYFGMLLGTFNERWLIYIIVLVAILSNVTALQRVLFAIRHCSTKAGT
jgi:archaetidylinositol phosphate synthase